MSIGPSVGVRIIVTVVDMDVVGKAPIEIGGVVHSQIVDAVVSNGSELFKHDLRIGVVIELRRPPHREDTISGDFGFDW